MKLGIALAGGGAKGAAHLGIIQALEENGIKADMYAGASAGSIVAGAKALGYTNKTILCMMDEISNDIIDYNYWGMIKALPFRFNSLESILKGKKLKKFLDANFNNSISVVKHPLSIVSSDLRTGSQVIFSSKDIYVPKEMDNLFKVYGEPEGLAMSEMIYASSAIPGIFPPTEINGHKLVDGSVLNTLPANVLDAMGATKIIAINLKSYDETPNIKGITSILSKSLTMMMDQNIDFSLYYAKNPMVLNPDLKDIGLLDFDRTREAYELGYVYGKSIANKVYDFVYEDA